MADAHVVDVRPRQRIARRIHKCRPGRSVHSRGSSSRITFSRVCDPVSIAKSGLGPEALVVSLADLVLPILSLTVPGSYPACIPTSGVGYLPAGVSPITGAIPPPPLPRPLPLPP